MGSSSERQPLYADRAVRLSRPTEGLLNMHRTIKFTGYQPGTAGISLSHSCRSTINRQGITLPMSSLSFVNVSLGRFSRKKGYKTVRVTAAVYRGFAPLNRSLTYRHWAGIRDYTYRFRSAVPYVFVKQSDPPCNCDLLIPAKLRQ